MDNTNESNKEDKEISIRDRNDEINELIKSDLAKGDNHSIGLSNNPQFIFWEQG